MHLESRANDELRLAQLEDALSDALACDPSQPVVLASDLNLDASKHGVAESLSSAGFRDAVLTAHVPTTPPRHVLDSGRHIDWAFVKGSIKADNGRVHSSVKASESLSNLLQFSLIEGTVTALQPNAARAATATLASLIHSEETS